MLENLKSENFWITALYSICLASLAVYPIYIMIIEFDDFSSSYLWGLWFVTLIELYLVGVLIVMSLVVKSIFFVFKTNDKKTKFKIFSMFIIFILLLMGSYLIRIYC